MKHLTIDFETRGTSPLRDVGAAAYANHPTTDVMCLALKWRGQEPKIWFPPWVEKEFSVQSELTAREVSLALADADNIEAHNMQFEYFIWKYVMARYGFPMLDAKKLRCSAAKAAMCGLPRDLAGACQVMGVRQQKDKEGAQLMMKLCKPRRALKADMARDTDWATCTYWRGDPQDIVRLAEYCKQDVRAEEALSDVLPNLPEYEQKVWLHDLIVNDRGIRVDTETTSAIIDCLTKHEKELLSEFRRQTGLKSPRQRDEMLAYMLALGVEMDGLKKDDVEKALAATDDEKVKLILSARQSLSKSSTKKFSAFIEASCEDDRVRGALMYHGARTGRWTGKIIQPQNFPRGTISEVEFCLELFQSGDLDSVRLFYGDPMMAASSCIRAMIIPGGGKEFVCADYSAIEGRGLPWLAGEQWVLAEYGRGTDMYKKTAVLIFKVSYDSVTKYQRAVGKVSDLAFGYNGGIAAFLAMAAALGLVIDTDDMFMLIVISLSGSEIKTVEDAGKWVSSASRYTLVSAILLLRKGQVEGEACSWIKKNGSRYAGGAGFLMLLSHNQEGFSDFIGSIPELNLRECVTNLLLFVARIAQIQRYVEAWRESHPATVALWKGLEGAAMTAVGNPGKVASFRSIRFGVSRGFLLMKLPSGRILYYKNPRFEDKMMKWGREKTVLAFDGVNSETRKWGTSYLYGGLLAENATQAVARDILVNGLMNVEKAGYEVVLHIHDEILAEIAEGKGDVEEFEKLMCQAPEWAEGLPLKAEGWSGKLYKK